MLSPASRLSLAANDGVHGARRVEGLLSLGGGGTAIEGGASEPFSVEAAGEGHSDSRGDMCSSSRP